MLPATIVTEISGGWSDGNSSGNKDDFAWGQSRCFSRGTSHSGESLADRPSRPKLSMTGRSRHGEFWGWSDGGSSGKQNGWTSEPPRFFPAGARMEQSARELIGLPPKLSMTRGSRHGEFWGLERRRFFWETERLDFGAAAFFSSRCKEGAERQGKTLTDWASPRSLRDQRLSSRRVLGGLERRRFSWKTER